jgi:2-succinyl-6-hydroxy-2,4-cyclohexadiene-1-carboxylate synthase
MLALHGFTGSGADFDPLKSALNLDFESPDLMGHGCGEQPVDIAQYRIDSVARRLKDTLGGRDLVLIGYSMGGRVALRLWPLLGSALRGLILVSANPGLEDVVDRTERIAQDFALAGKIEERGMAWFCEHWAATPMIGSQANISIDALAAMGRRRAKNSPHGLANALRGMGQGAVAPVWDTLSEIPVPTLLLTGAQDRSYTAIAGRMQGLIPEAVHITVPNTGHCCHLEAVDTVAAHIVDFLSGLSE